jgi:curved DNA-binding protein CbpA
MDPAFVAEIETLAQILDQLDYFQVLKLEQSATPIDVKAAFHRESRLCHPDRFNALPDSPLKAQVARVYKRMTEAYVTLKDDVKRAKYLTDINGPEREAKLRFTEADAAEAQLAQKKEKEEAYGQTPKTKQLYQAALRDIEGEKYDSGLRNLKLAASFEPGNAKFKEKIAEVEAAMKAASKAKKR